MNQQNVLLIFVKNTVKGKVKTRLAKTLGEDKALEVYKDLLSYTHKITKDLSLKKIAYYNEWIAQEDIFHTGNYDKAVQVIGELGVKMKKAFELAFENNAENVIIIGSDCPELTHEIILEAFEALKKHDVVLGPAVDGGYYLLGMSTFLPFLFDNKEWSTPTVFEATKVDIEKHQLSLYELPVLSDIDTEKDYHLLKHKLH